MTAWGAEVGVMDRVGSPVNTGIRIHEEPERLERCSGANSACEAKAEYT